MISQLNKEGRLRTMSDIKSLANHKRLLARITRYFLIMISVFSCSIPKIDKNDVNSG